MAGVSKHVAIQIIGAVLIALIAVANFFVKRCKENQIHDDVAVNIAYNKWRQETIQNIEDLLCSISFCADSNLD